MSREELRGAAGLAALLVGSWALAILALAILWWIGSQLSSFILGLPW